MFERFTKPARAVVGSAESEARRLRQAQIGTEHFLLALLDQDAGGAYTVLHDAGLEQAEVRAAIERSVGKPARLLTDDDAEALKTIGIDLDAVLASVERSLGPDVWSPPVADPEPERRGLLRRRQDGQTAPRRSRFGPRAKKVLELSVREAIRLHSDAIGSEHILLGLLREGDGLAAKILVDAGLTIEDLRRATLDQLGRAA